MLWQWAGFMPWSTGSPTQHSNQLSYLFSPQWEGGKGGGSEEKRRFWFLGRSFPCMKAICVCVFRTQCRYAGGLWGEIIKQGVCHDRHHRQLAALTVSTAFNIPHNSVCSELSADMQVVYERKSSNSAHVTTARHRQLAALTVSTTSHSPHMSVCICNIYIYIYRGYYCIKQGFIMQNTCSKAVISATKQTKTCSNRLRVNACIMIQK